MKENNERPEKKRIKGQKGRIVGKIIATLMVGFMLIASCSTAIYYLVNQQ